jgi:phenylacetate-CoA ligase
MANIRAELARNIWLSTLQKFHLDPRAPANDRMWSPKLDAASRDELMAIQTEKLQAVVPFLYENSAFYRRRFEKLGMIPSDLKSLEDLSKWPPIDKTEMMEDAPANPPYGTYTTMTDDVWAERGWMMFSSSGSTGVPRVFRYSHIDRQYWAWANARACHAMGFRKGDTVFMMTGYGPHVFAWGVQYAMEVMGLPTIPGGGMDARARVGIINRFKPTILLCTPSYALHLARVMQGMGLDPAASSVRLLLLGGEPVLSIMPTWQRIEALWGARVVEFYGCTEASPHVGGYSCTADRQDGETVGTHLMEDVQIWETVDPDTREPQPYGSRGLTVCTSLASESSPQLRFLVGDYTVLDPAPCPPTTSSICAASRCFRRRSRMPCGRSQAQVTSSRSCLSAMPRGSIQ